MPETVFLQVTHLELASSGMMLVITVYFYFSYFSCLKYLIRISLKTACMRIWFYFYIKKNLNTLKGVFQSYSITSLKTFIANTYAVLRK